MQISKQLYFIGFLLILSAHVFSQDSAAVKFAYNNEVIHGKTSLIIKAIIQPGIKLYAINQKSPDAVSSSIKFDTAFFKILNGSIKEQFTPKTEKDAALGMDVNYFTDSAIWIQNINVKPEDSLVVKGALSYLYKKGEEFVPGESNIRFFITPEKTGTAGSIINAAPTGKGMLDNKSLWLIFALAFGGGLLALITPCVYSMIPVTVSFFTKRSKTKEEGIKNAVYYALSIIIIFTLLGFLVTVLFGPAALNNLATNWIANLIFFALFVIFGFSFLGAFEIQLPSSWSNKSDSKAATSSFMGIFFMALTLVLVSFSCTGPIIGNLLVLASKGSFYGPLIGMFGFSLALALPFALFAFFPSKLNVLGKAGGWLNAVKVTLGFLELALALKFLSNADLVKGWRLLDREVFIVLWIVIFGLLGFYLLGKLKFHHDDELPKNDFGLPYLTVTRLFFAITSLGIALYMVPGLWGAPLKVISSFVPPMGTQDFIAASPSAGSNTSEHNTTGIGELPHPVKYYEQMKIYEPEVVKKYGMTTYFDYNEALEVARKEKKPLMLDFTGINCVNCRLMEGQVWSDPQVMKRLKEDFVIVSLYIDVHSVDLPENEQYNSKALGKRVETLGDKNADMQVSKYGANTQPYYFFLSANENRLNEEGYGYDPDIQKFIKLLDGVKEKYNKSQKDLNAGY
jgi:cytochrome c biogenesis protein CcdA/thioredoxin-related protein